MEALDSVFQLYSASAPMGLWAGLASPCCMAGTDLRGYITTRTAKREASYQICTMGLSASSLRPVKPTTSSKCIFTEIRLVKQQLRHNSLQLDIKYRELIRSCIEHLLRSLQNFPYNTLSAHLIPDRRACSLLPR